MDLSVFDSLCILKLNKASILGEGGVSNVDFTDGSEEVFDPSSAHPVSVFQHCW